MELNEPTARGKMVIYHMVNMEEADSTSRTEQTSNLLVEGGTVIPDEARDMAKRIKENNGTPPKGYKGGRTYKNVPVDDSAQKLPEGVNYKEYDIYPYIKGQNRGAERIVIGDDGSVWYTNDHYQTFTRIE